MAKTKKIKVTRKGFVEIKYAELEKLQAASKAYEELENKVGEFYDETSPKYHSGDLTQIGEMVATYFGYL